MCVSTPGIQSPEQQSALARHDPARPIFVEGPFSLWLRDKCVYYHILRADLLPPEERVRAQSGSQGSGKSELAQRCGGGRGDRGTGGQGPGKRPQVASRPGASDSACTASPGQEVEEIPEEWNLYYPMQLDLAYGRSSWDDYKFDIDEGKNRDRSNSEHCMGRGAASGVEG